jgi:tetratricopeptide (TPR) repeat protein
MKTFHSTQILRHLFTVHASLAEFDLAFKAYDSYVEIVTRGKDRAEKSGEEDLGIDDDNMVLRTSAEAIRILCRFGARKDAEKAMEISNNMEKWLEPSQHIEPNGTEGGSSRFVESAVAPRALAVAFSAIGVCQAHWARYTYSADLRATIQKKSVQYLRKSLEPKFEEADNIETLYALALVLAEMRDIPAAIKEAKRALSPATRQKAYMSTDGVLSGGVVTEFGRERKLIPVWHLLALLLTTRSEFSAAEKACEAAFEQFGDPTTLFGKENENGTYRSDHLNEASGRTTNAKVSNLVDQMESFERGGILEIKMTQLALVEVMEGPDAAVDSCDELLALYTRLFGDPTAEKSRLQPPAATIAPPKSAIGTVKGSMFRSRGSVKGTQRDSTLRNSPTTGSHPSAEVAQVNAAPTIQVTEDHGAHHGKSHHHHLPFHHKHEDEKTGVTRSPSKLLKRSSNSLRRRSEIANEQSVDVPGVPVNTTNGPPARSNTVRTKSPRRSSMSSSIRKSIESNDRQLRPIAHNMSHTAEPLPSGHTRQPPKQDVRLATPFPGADYIPPDPHFSQIQIRRHKVTLLVDIWGFICRLYTRAGMFDDAKGAVNEALKLAETFEAEVAQGESSSKAFADRGWGGGRSVEKLWADAFTAVSRPTYD